MYFHNKTTITFLRIKFRKKRDRATKRQARARAGEETSYGEWVGRVKSLLVKLSVVGKGSEPLFAVNPTTIQAENADSLLLNSQHSKEWKNSTTTGLACLAPEASSKIRVKLRW